jgi:hypothetical protein
VENELKTEWAAAMSAPANYPIYSPTVLFFSNGEMINSTGTTTSIGDASWSYPSTANFSHRKISLPDSVFVSYTGLDSKQQMFVYSGGAKLPLTVIKELFTNGYRQGNQYFGFRNITAGLAPGGRVCVWVDHVEVTRFKVKEDKKVSDKPLIYFEEIDSIRNYLRLHPVRYSFWEQADAFYNLGFGFCSEDGKSEFDDYSLNTKEGIAFWITNQDVQKTLWNVPFGEPVTLNSFHGYQSFKSSSIRTPEIPLPVHMTFYWKNNNMTYTADAAMPENLPTLMSAPYINPDTGKKAGFSRIILGVKNNGRDAEVWLDGPGRQVKLCDLEGTKYITEK